MWINGVTMKRGIVITTHKSTEPFLNDLLISLRDCKYPIVITYNTNQDNQYEMRGLKLGMSLFDEFIYLQDTIEIKDQELFDILFSKKGMYSISPRFLMYIGKYDSKELMNYNLPSVSNKYEAVMGEAWLRDNVLSECFDQTFIDGNNFEFKHGRKNMVLENKYLKKYKGTFTMEQAIAIAKSEELYKTK